MRIKDYIPIAYYSDGTESKCLIYKICNMFDIDPQSYMIVKEPKIMKKEKESKTTATKGRLNRDGFGWSDD